MRVVTEYEWDNNRVRQGRAPGSKYDVLLDGQIREVSFADFGATSHVGFCNAVRSAAVKRGMVVFIRKTKTGCMVRAQRA